MSAFDTFGRTKVICTIGPATKSLERLRDLIAAGMDVARLNFSHGNREEHHQLIENIRKASAEAGEHVAILQDLSGPKIRTGMLAKGSVELRAGDAFVFTTDEVEGDQARVSTTYRHLPSDVKPGDVILVDDGKLAFRVENVSEHDVRCTVETGGILKNKKGMNLPGVPLSVGSMTEKDDEDLAYGLQEGVDFVALSFVRAGEDIRVLRRKIEAAGKRVPVIAKIERGEALDHFEEILDESDGIMVARGDLGVELPPEEVPLIQKNIVSRCNAAGKPVIIATQMLESMVDSPRPTRAEASDVANAVLDGTDAVMLSGETSVGAYPVEAAKMMDQIIRRAERAHKEHLDAAPVQLSREDRVFDAMARSACVLAHELGATAIVSMTHTGRTAIAITRYRPYARIVAVTGDERVVRKLNLVWNVRGLLLPDLSAETDKAFAHVIRLLKEQSYVSAGDRIVFTAGIPLMTRTKTNTIKVETVA